MAVLVVLVELMAGVAFTFQSIWCFFFYKDLECALFFLAGTFFTMFAVLSIDGMIIRRRILGNMRKERRREAVIWIDMDGVLAKFENVDVNETYNEGFFASRQPDMKAVSLVRELVDRGFDVRILTSAYENGFAGPEKIRWLCSPSVGLSDVEFYSVRYGSDKSCAVTDLEPVNLLIDDYSVNLRKWENHKNGKFVGLKWYNGTNGSNGTWENSLKPYIRNDQTIKEMVRTIRRTVASV